MLKKTTKELCALCKGSRRLCGSSVCPILVKKSLRIIAPRISKRELNVYSEWVLVGEYGYPRLRCGPISAISSVPWEPEVWAEKRLDFSGILKFRVQSIYPFQRRHINKPPSIYEPIGESIISVKPINVELVLKKPPRMRLRLDADIPPVGGTAPLKGLELGENPKIPRKIDSILEDRIKAFRAVGMLYNYGLSPYYIQKVFSAGFLGVEERRRLVPTRWSITAVDSILGNIFLKQIRHKPSIQNVELYFWEYLGNKYYIVLIPSDYWAMEMFEIWLPNSVWLKGVGHPIVIQNHEDYDGKPIKMDGGYYAIRTSILEWLKNNNRVTMALAIRIITPQYIAPVGNWQIRESIKLALKNNLIAHGDLEEILNLIETKEPVLKSINIRKRSWLIKRTQIPTINKLLN